MHAGADRRTPEGKKELLGLRTGKPMPDTSRPAVEAAVRMAFGEDDVD